MVAAASDVPRGVRPGLGGRIERWLWVAGFVVGGCREMASSPTPVTGPPAAEATVAAALAPSTPTASSSALAPSSSADEARRARGSLELSFVDDFNPPRPASGGGDAAPAAAWDAALGGLSALFYSAPEGVLYALTDDRGRFPPRLYTFSVELGERSLRVVPRSVVPLHEPKPTGVLVEMDGEGLTGDGHTLFLSVEGRAEPPSETRVLRVARDGLVDGELAVPLAFHSMPSGPATGGPATGGPASRGARPNLGFEGLSASPSGRYLFACAEAALYQDGELPTFDRGSVVRMVRWDLERGGPPVELSYRTDPVTPRMEAPTAAQTGVSEIVALDDERLLVLERSYVAAGGRHVNEVRIFEADLRGLAFGGASLPLAPKRLVLNLDDVVDRFDEGLRELDNFEGMTLGPRLPSGNPSLLLVSDDNFSATQRTVFVALELRTRR